MRRATNSGSGSSAAPAGGVLMRVTGVDGDVVCFPPAGCSAGVFQQMRRLGKGLCLSAVEHPGSGISVSEWATHVAAALSARSTIPVLLGASLGAMVALETAQALEDLGRGTSGVVVAGSVAPQHRSAKPGRARPDSDLLDVMAASGGGDAMWSARPAVRRHALRTLRRDLEWADSYRGPRTVPLRGRLVAVRGNRDAMVSDEAGTTAWAQWTVCGFRSVTVDGPHLFFTGERGAHALWDVIRSLSPLPGKRR